MNASDAPNKVSLFRRVGRKGSLLLRPFYLPLLTRLQRQLQAAFEQSSIPPQLHELSQQTVSVASNIEVASLRIDRLQVGLDALRIDQIELEERLFEDLRQLLSKHLDLLTQSQRPRIPLVLGDEALVRTPEGYLLVPAEDRTLLTAMWELGGRLEPGTIRVLTTLLSEGANVIDVGAHVGLTVLPAARKVGSSGHVIAFEPGTRVADLLRKNVALNFLSDRVTIHQCAAGETAGTACLHLSAIYGESSLLELSASVDTEPVEVRTIDSLVDPHLRIRLAKIDAEGYEPRVWKGMQRVIRDNPDLVALVEFGPAHLRRSGISITDWLETFKAPGFALYEIDELDGRLKPLRSAETLQLVTSLNLLLIRQPPAKFPGLQFE